MTYRVGISETLHITGDVPVEGNTVEDSGPGHADFQAIHLGDYSEGQRFDLIFSGSLRDQIATLDRLSAELHEAAGRAIELLAIEADA